MPGFTLRESNVAPLNIAPFTILPANVFSAEDFSADDFSPTDILLDSFIILALTFQCFYTPTKFYARYYTKSPHPQTA
jgi:hypothetical protein